MNFKVGSRFILTNSFNVVNDTQIIPHIHNLVIVGSSWAVNISCHVHLSVNLHGVFVTSLMMAAVVTSMVPAIMVAAMMFSNDRWVTSEMSRKPVATVTKHHWTTESNQKCSENCSNHNPRNDSCRPMEQVWKLHSSSWHFIMLIYEANW